MPDGLLYKKPFFKRSFTNFLSGKSISFAVVLILVHYLGEREFAGQAGFVDEFSFDYVTPVAFIAESPDGTFSVKEEKDVIRILKSFKVAEME